MAIQDVVLKSPGTNPQDVALAAGASPQALTAPLMASSTAFYAPSVSFAQTLTAPFKASSTAFYAPTVALGGVTNNAVRFDANADTATLATVPSSVTSYTLISWVKISVDRNAYSTIFVWTDGANYHQFETEADGTTLVFYDQGSATPRVSAPASVGVWYKVGVVVGSSTADFYFGQEGTPGVTKTTVAIANLPSTAATFYIGGSPWSEYIDGAMQGLRVWNAQLTEAEVTAEFTSATPVVTAGLLGAWFPPSVTVPTALTAISGSNLNNTGGTYTVEAGPTLDSGGAGAQTLTVPLKASSTSLYTPTVNTLTYALTVPFKTSSGVSYTPTLQSVNALTAPFKASSAVLYAGSVTPGAVTVTAPLKASSAVLYTPVVGTGGALLSAPFKTSSAVLYAGTVTPGAVTIIAPLKASSTVLYAGSVAPGAVGLTAPFKASSFVAYAPTVVKQPYVLTAPFQTSSGVSYAPTLRYNQTLTAPFKTSSTSFYGPTISGAADLTNIGFAPGTNTNSGGYAPTSPASAPVQTWSNSENIGFKDNHPSGSGELFVLAFGSATFLPVIQKSGDSGATWTFVNTSGSWGSGSGGVFASGQTNVVYTAVQDSTGAIHAMVIRENFGQWNYLRITPTYTSGQLTGFTKAADYILTTPTTAGELRVDMRVIRNGAGTECLSLSSLCNGTSGGAQPGSRVHITISDSVTPAAASNWKDLAGTASSWTTVFDNVHSPGTGGPYVNDGSHEVHQHVEQIGTGPDLWLIVGPHMAEQAVPNDRPIEYYRFASTGNDTWSIGSATTLVGTDGTSAPQLLSTSANATELYIFYADPTRGLQLATLNSSGTLTHLISPQGPRAALRSTVHQYGIGTLQAANDGRLWLMWLTNQQLGSVSEFKHAFWNGSAWSVSSDSVNPTQDPFYTFGARQTRGWNGLTSVINGNWGGAPGDYYTATIYGGSLASSAQTLTVPPAASTVALFAPTVSKLTYSLTAPFQTSSSVSYAPTLTYNVSAPFKAPSTSLFAGSVTRGTVALVAPFVGSTVAAYAPTVVKATYGLTVPLKASDTVAYAPTVVKPPYSLTAPFKASSSSLYAGTVSPGTATLTAPLKASSTALYAPFIGTGGALLGVPFGASSTSLFAPTANTLTYVLAAPFKTSSTVLYGSTIVRGLTAPFKTSTTVLFAGTVNRGTVTLTAPFKGSSFTFYAPFVSNGGVVLSAPFKDSSTVLYAGSISTGSTSLTAPLLTSAGVRYAPTLSSVRGLAAPFRTSTAALYAPTATRSNTLVIPFAASTTSSYAPAVTPGVRSLVAPRLASSVALYPPSFARFLQVPFKAVTTNLFGPTVVPGAVGVTAPRIGSTVALYTPSIANIKFLLAPFKAASTTLFAGSITARRTLTVQNVISSTQLYSFSMAGDSTNIPPTIGPFTALYAPAVSARVSIGAPRIGSNANLFTHVLRLEGLGPTPEVATLPLIRALELPLPATLTRILGIHQSDVIIRSALNVGLADLRANPWLLDYVFASLPQDSLTWKDYGEKDVQEARKWFLRTHIPVNVLPHMDESKWPCMTIELLDSSEVVPETTIGDINYDPEEDNDTSWPPLTPQFTPIAYTPATGAVTLPAIPECFIAPGMFLVDRNGTAHELIDVTDQTHFTISPGTVADLRNSVLKSRRPSWKVSAESSSFRETYRIGIHAQSETSHLTWLHSIVLFSLLRYKQVLLEARGFERTTVQSSQMARDERFEAENVFSRYITITGNVRQFWPKTVAPVLDLVEMDTIVSAEGKSGFRVSGQNANVRVADTGLDPRSQLWIGNNDE